MKKVLFRTTNSTVEKFGNSHSSKLFYFKIWGIRYYAIKKVFWMRLGNSSLCRHVSHATHNSLMRSVSWASRWGYRKSGPPENCPGHTASNWQNQDSSSGQHNAQRLHYVTLQVKWIGQPLKEHFRQWSRDPSWTPLLGKTQQLSKVTDCHSLLTTIDPKESSLKQA